MTNSDNRTAPKKTYSISNKQMLQFIDKLPTLKDNNKNTEFLLPVQTKNEVITADNLQNNSFPAAGIASINIKFSYDFVMDRWFLNDKRIEVVDLDRS